MRYFAFILLANWGQVFAQPDTVWAGTQEYLLYTEINAYRDSNGLEPIPFSKSLTFVAQQHVSDLVLNNPVVGNCNMHSWSNNGPWTPCCYTPDHAQAQCMWDKPGELTNYLGNGYENAFGSGGLAAASAALQAWQASPSHNDVILNLNTWASFTWNSLGVGIYQNYAVIWFGTQVDPEGEPTVPLSEKPSEIDFKLVYTPGGLRVLGHVPVETPYFLYIFTLKGVLVKRFVMDHSDIEFPLVGVAPGLYLAVVGKKGIEGWVRILHVPGPR